MMNAWELPTSLSVGGQEWKIRTDFRAVLDILKYFADPEYEPDEQWAICLDILYEDFEQIPPYLHEEAAKQAVEFIDMGIKDNGKKKPTLMNWEHDAPIIIPAINKEAGMEVRAVPYMHWHTFLGHYMSIGESLYAHVISIRAKRAKGKKLEKWEEEFCKDNKTLIDLQNKSRERSQEEKDELRALFGIRK